jgi:two-component system, cell cycle sensor histidine kinase and response regulator CckA
VLEAVLSNALESIDKDGTISVATFKESIERDLAEPHPLLPAGEYTVVSMEDNGFGMDGDTLSRIFEPFFTTKIRGRGLGMSAAYGIIRNHGGNIYVKSKHREGTRIKIYLPGVADEKR